MKRILIYISAVSLMIICFQVLAFAQVKAETAKQAYNKGIDLYKKLDYNKAVNNFLKSFNTKNKKLEQWTNYNLGNAHFEKGTKAQKSKNPTALKEYENALSFFRRAMELDPDDKDAKYNYEVTKLRLEELKKQQRQESSEEKQNKQKEKNEQEQQQNEQQQQDEQGQQSQSEKTQNNKSDAQKQQEDKLQKSQARPQKMTKEQAQMLLDNFRNSEERPTQLRQFNQNEASQEVDKDW